MGCQNCWSRSSAQYILMRSQNIYAVGIQYHWTVRIFQNSPHHLQGSL